MSGLRGHYSWLDTYSLSGLWKHLKLGRDTKTTCVMMRLDYVVKVDAIMGPIVNTIGRAVLALNKKEFGHFQLHISFSTL